jgi:hypothetical protein
VQVQESSIDWIVGSGDESGRIRAEEERQRGDLRRLRHPPHGLHLRELLHHGLLAPGISFVQEAIDEWCVNARRRDAIAADIVSDVVARDRVGHGQHRALAHRIGKSVGEASDSGDRRQIQNHTASGCLHGIDCGVHAVVDALHVDTEDTLEVLIAGVLQLANVRDSRIVDKDVNRAAAPDLAENVFDLLLIGDVAQMPLRRATLVANRGCGFFGVLLIYFDDVNRGARLREADCDRLTNAACAAGHDCSLAVQPKKARVGAV